MCCKSILRLPDGYISNPSPARPMKSLPLLVLPIIFAGMFYVGFAGVSSGTHSLPVPHAVQTSFSTPSSVWWVGAASTDSSALPNTGVRGTIQVIDFSTNNVFDAWVADDLTNNEWGQVGYYILSGGAPVAFYQIWNLNSNTVLTTGTAAVSVGSHSFSMYLQSGTTWAFALDGVVFGTYDMGASSSVSAGFPAYALVEEQGTAVFSFPSVTFSPALQTRQGGAWGSVATAVSYGSAWGVEGHDQDSSLSSDEIVVGTSVPAISAGIQLWGSGSTPRTTSTLPAPTTTVTTTVTSVSTTTRTVTITQPTTVTTTQTDTSPITTTRTDTSTVTSPTTKTSTQTVTSTMTGPTTTVTSPTTYTTTVTSPTTVTKTVTTTTGSQATSTVTVTSTSTSTYTSTVTSTATVTSTSTDVVTSTATTTPTVTTTRTVYSTTTVTQPGSTATETRTILLTMTVTSAYTSSTTVYLPTTVTKTETGTVTVTVTGSGSAPSGTSPSSGADASGGGSLASSLSADFPLMAALGLGIGIVLIFRKALPGDR